MSETLINNALNRIQSGAKVLFVWSGASTPAELPSTLERVQERAGAASKVSVEHTDRLSLADHADSSFDLVLSNVLTPASSVEPKRLAGYLKLLKPNGLLVEFGTAADVESELKLCGYKSVRVEKNGGEVGAAFAEKPSFEVGAASKLKFAKPSAPVAKVWQFSENDIQEDDLINTDELLDEVDLKKPPSVEAKFDCGTSAAGKKKACKNCTCGLAEEIETEAKGQQEKNKQAAPVAKSACGSCYLGDAFRCTSCPYLGMPAFKPGEKIQITDSLLKADI